MIRKLVNLSPKLAESSFGQADVSRSNGIFLNITESNREENLASTFEHIFVIALE